MLIVTARARLKTGESGGRSFATQQPAVSIKALAQALQAQPLIGDGTVHRAIADTQKRFFDPPRFAPPLLKRR